MLLDGKQLLITMQCDGQTHTCTTTQWLTPRVRNTLQAGANKADDAVVLYGEHTYLWNVPARAGPGPNDPSSLMWMYHSHVAEDADTYAGLAGAIIITKSGGADAAARPTDVDK